MGIRYTYLILSDISVSEIKVEKKWLVFFTYIPGKNASWLDNSNELFKCLRYNGTGKHSRRAQHYVIRIVFYGSLFIWCDIATIGLPRYTMKIKWYLQK